MTQRIYLDNAATTEMRDEVKALMHEKIDTLYGNPSSLYEEGRNSKNEIEKARLQVAHLLGGKPSEIFFTSGGTESSNAALWCYIAIMGIRKIVTSRIEHHATYSTAHHLADKFGAELIYVDLDDKGRVQLDHLENIVHEVGEENILISLMHANNEVGNITDIQRLSDIAHPANVHLHMDMVQTIGHYRMDLDKLNVNIASGSSHKYHGPKGVGLMYVKGGSEFLPMLMGGAQERKMRAGTENLYGILGLAKALEISMEKLDEEMPYIRGLKSYAIEKIKKELPNAIFHGDPEGESLYTVINIGLENCEKTEMLLFHLDMKGYSLSGGSACSSGIQSSHVIANIYGNDHPYTPLRISFSKNNSKKDVDGLIDEIKHFL